MKLFKKPFFRFLLVGGTNTVITYLLYLAVIQFFDYKIAFTVSFIVGIFIAYGLNSFFVFKTPFSWAKIAQYPLVYVGQYLIGLGLLFVAVNLLRIDARVAPLLNVVILLPFTYALNKWFLVGRTK
jgi:putative flippase GtrA